jgi:hypothetical protein
MNIPAPFGKPALDAGIGRGAGVVKAAVMTAVITVGQGEPERIDGGDGEAGSATTAAKPTYHTTYTTASGLHAGTHGPDFALL